MSTDDKNGKEVAAGSVNGDAEQREEKLKYPRAVPFIISNEFCERFNYYGMRTILSLYFTNKLGFTQKIATVLYHSFTTLVYFFCVIGAIIADSWWGKFHTILWLSLVYVAGSTVVAIGAIESWNMPATTLTMIGLGLIAFGSGGIKPCVAAFGGEQFTMPQQAKQLALFFSAFYFSINLGSFISTSVTPILREQSCFGQTDCFSLGFGLPAALMAISVVIFIGGKFLYKLSPPQGNMLVKVSKCIGNAISTKSREKTTNPKEHWLDYAESAYGKKLVMETKILLNVLVLYLPLPLFWALFDQQGSRWTFQATRMTGDLGFYTIKPDQMQVVNPLLILVFIPLYEVVFYPLLNLVGIRRPLQKIALGGIFAGIAFLCSMFVEITLEPTYPVLPKVGEAQFRIFNGLNCEYTLNSNIFKQNAKIGPNSFHIDLNIPIEGNDKAFPFVLTSTTPNCGNAEGFFEMTSNEAKSFFITGMAAAPTIQPYTDNPQKSVQGNPFVRVLSNLVSSSSSNIVLKDKDGDQYNSKDHGIDLALVPSSVYEVFVDGISIRKDVEMKLGGVYTILIQERTANDYVSEVIIITSPNSVSMLWLIPQYVIMTLGEVMYSVTGLQFSFTQAPESMKSVLQGCWLLTVAFGNLIVTIIVGASFFESQTYEFALFAGLMFLDMGLFSWLAYRFKAISLDEIKKIEDEEKEALNDSGKKEPLDFPGTSEGTREARID